MKSVDQQIRFLFLIFPFVLWSCNGNTGSGNTATTATPLDLRFNTSSPSTGINVSRASTATYINSSGTITTASPNTPRFEYDFIRQSMAGILIEPSATNYLPYSGAMSNAFYTASASGLSYTSLAGSTTLAPDGTAAAVSYAEDTSTGPHATSFSSVPWTDNTPFAFSLFYKLPESNSAGGVTFSVTNVGAAGSVSMVNLWGGGSNSVSSATSGVGGYVSLSTESFPNGWTRISITGVMSTSSGLIPSVTFTQSDGTTSYTGSGNSIYVWGAQLEAGADFSSYIPTGSSAVTRAADSVSFSADPSWYSQSQGTWVISAAPKTSASQVTLMSAVGSSSSASYYEMTAETSNSGLLSGIVVTPSTGTQTSMVDDHGLHWDDPFRFAFSYGPTSTLVSTLGLVGNTAADTVMPVITTIQLGQDHTGAVLYSGYISEVVYYSNQTNSTNMPALTQ